MCTPKTASPSFEKENVVGKVLDVVNEIGGFNLTPWSCECRSVPEAQSEFHDVV